MSKGDPEGQRIETYWRDFYGHVQSLPHERSAFAASLTERLSGVDIIVDIGCGNGRDSRFFAANGASVIAVDESREALNLVQSYGSHVASEAIQVLEVNLSRGEAYAPLHRELESSRRAKPAVCVAAYARFVLHAVTSQTQRTILLQLSNILKPGESAYLEYRTGADPARYIFGDHYRRLVDVAGLEAEVAQLGFSSCRSEVSDRFATYGDESPICARTVVVR